MCNTKTRQSKINVKMTVKKRKYPTKKYKATKFYKTHFDGHKY